MNEIYGKEKLHCVLKIFKFLFFHRSDNCILKNTFFIVLLSTIEYWWNLNIIYEENTNLFLVEFWTLGTNYRSFYDFQKMVIWGQFVFSSWLLTILTARVHIFKRTKILTAGWKLKTGLELSPSIQNQTKKSFTKSLMFHKVSPWY